MNTDYMQNIQVFSRLDNDFGGIIENYNYYNVHSIQEHGRKDAGHRQKALDSPSPYGVGSLICLSFMY